MKETWNRTDVRPDSGYLSRTVSKVLLAEEGMVVGGRDTEPVIRHGSCNQPRGWSVRARVECVGRVSGMSMSMRIATELEDGYGYQTFRPRKKDNDGRWSMVDDR